MTGPCPSWCAVPDHSGDVDRVAGLRYQHHSAEPLTLVYTDPDDPLRSCLRRLAQVHVERYDTEQRRGRPAVRLDGVHPDFAMRVSDAEALARLLLDAVARAREPELECLDCGHPFALESSPHPDRCWSCAERADLAAVT